MADKFRSFREEHAEAVQEPAPKHATFTDGTPPEKHDPHKGHGGEFVIDEQGNRVRK